MFGNQCLLVCRRVSVWEGVTHYRLLGPDVVPYRLTGAVYHRFLLNNIQVLLEHGRLHQRQYMWFMHYWAPPHFLLIVI
jgi:hypothetical protein